MHALFTDIVNIIVPCRILQKHIKRQIISLNGGFQVIADLNAYHAFIASLKVGELTFRRWPFFPDRFSSTKVPNITADFDHLKMLGHVFVVEDAKDLAQIVRDVTRYGGAYRPEVRFLHSAFPFSNMCTSLISHTHSLSLHSRYHGQDVYEFIQRRSDWKNIEKTVDKTMYNLSFKEDCVIC